MNTKAHWEKVYSTKSHKDVSWFAEHVTTSLALIARGNLPKDAPAIDIGGGASTLVDDLIEAGYSDLTVFDISGAALEIARMRLEAMASTVRWIEDDILTSDLGGREYGLWHDRAVFHFLTAEADRQSYRKQVAGHLRVGGLLVMSVFAEDGPEKCSGLTVKRHGEGELAAFFGEGYETVHAEPSVHTTPSGAGQRFVNLVLRRLR